MIDIEIQISISERSSGWAINYVCICTAIQKSDNNSMMERTRVQVSVARMPIYISVSARVIYAKENFTEGIKQIYNKIEYKIV